MIAIFIISHIHKHFNVYFVNKENGHPKVPIFSTFIISLMLQLHVCKAHHPRYVLLHIGHSVMQNE